ncbi:MAG: efflux RND transporter permease subunit [Gemmatimonadales bacterium]|nr:efflux RND transporter permease subunit [Gemmatimonadales bacterium]MDZ4389650.1 efflux RND transporter permease subunit [Gemmatimonadales bacterium]
MIRWAAGRPAVIWSMAVGIVIAGGVAFTKLPLATKTTVELPKISVSGSWRGASPELIETYITSPLESAIQGVRGVRKVSSTSREHQSTITVELDPRADVTLARLAILERVETLRPDLPPAARNGVRVSNWVPEELTEQNLMEINVTGPYTPGALAKIAEDRVVPRLSALPGIAGVSVRGGARLGVAVAYNPANLRQLGIDPTAIQSAIGTARLVDAIGTEQLGANERNVVLRDVPSTIDELARLPVRASNGRVFALGELTTIRPDEDAEGNFYRLNGVTAVSLSLARQPTADAIKTAAAAREALDIAQTALPPGVVLKIASDQSEDLAKQLRDLLLRGAIAFGSVAIILMLTLRSLRSTLLVLGSATVAIAGTALGLYLLKIPANLLTLAGLAMGIGILVQNGLVVVERLRSVPDTPDHRARAGSRIAPAVVGATLTTAVVLFPFLFLQGNARAAFAPFAAAFALALFWSVATALVLIPAVGRGTGTDAGWPRLHRAYHLIARTILRWRLITLTLTVASIAVLSWGFVKKVPRSSWGGWGGERRATVSANVTFPKGSDPAEVERLIRELERVAVGRPGVALVRAQGSQLGGNLVVEFTAEGSLTEVPWVIADELTQRAVMIGGTDRVSVTPPEGQGFYGGSSSGGSVTRRIKVLGYSFQGVLNLAEDLQRRLEQITRVRDVNINAGSYWGRERQVSISLDPDRLALGRVGATTRDFATSLSLAVQGGGGGTMLEMGDEEVEVTLRAEGVRDRQLRDLEGSEVLNPSRSPIRISDVAVVREVEGLATIEREDQQYVRILSYDFRGPQKLADNTHKAFMAAIGVPTGYTVSDDRFEWGVDDSTKGLWLVFAIGVVLVLLSVALVFDSWWASGMVFLSLPLALGGVVAAFWSTGTAFTREAAVGVILVVGLAVNQAILLIDGVLAAKRRHGGAATGADVLRATRDRAGMIVLVTLTTIGSLVPMAWGAATTSIFGAIALATAGGTVAGTLGALFLLPAILVGGWRGIGRGRRQKSASGER